MNAAEIATLILALDNAIKIVKTLVEFLRMNREVMTPEQRTALRTSIMANEDIIKNIWELLK